MKRSALALAVVLALAQLASAPPVAVAPAPVANVSGLKPEKYGSWTRVWEFESIASMRSFTNATYHFVAKGGVMNATIPNWVGYFEAFRPVGLRRIAIAMRLAYTPPKSTVCHLTPIYICEGDPVLYLRVGLNTTILFELALYIGPSRMGIMWHRAGEVYPVHEFAPLQNEWFVLILDLPNGYWRVVNGSSNEDVAYHDVTPVSDSNYYQLMFLQYDYIYLYEVDWIAVNETSEPVTLYPSGFSPYDRRWLPPSGSWKYVIDFSLPGSIGFPEYPGWGTAAVGYSGWSVVRNGRLIVLAGGQSAMIEHTMYTYLRRLAVALRANVTYVNHYSYVFLTTTNSAVDQAAIYTTPGKPSLLTLYNGGKTVYSIVNPGGWFVFVVDNVTSTAYVYDRRGTVLFTMPVTLRTSPDSPLIYIESDAFNTTQDIYNVEIDWIAIWDEPDHDWRFVLLNASAPANAPPGSTVPVTVTVYLDGWWDPNEVGEVRLYNMSGALIAARQFKVGDYNDTVFTITFANVTLPGVEGIFPYTVEIYNVNKRQVDDRLTLNIMAVRPLNVPPSRPPPPPPSPQLPLPGAGALLALLIMWWWLLFLLLLLLLLLLIRRRKEEEGEEIVFIP